MGTTPDWRSSRRSGPVRTRSAAIVTPCCAPPRWNSAMPGATSISAPMPTPDRCFATTCTRFRARSARRSAPRPCSRRRRGGFNPVPHIAVRRLASFTQASDFLQRAVGEAQIRTALIIGGDPDYPVGPFPDSADLLGSGLIEGYGLREVAFAGYPE